MKTPMPGQSRTGAVALGIWFLLGPPALGSDDGSPPPRQSPQKASSPFHKHKDAAQGTLGYGPPGLQPGFQGFGLGYHQGYGFGGKALGVGAEGGYPFYGGPGYPHPAPTLRRIGRINPFPYFGGPGGPSPACPNFFGAVGPLAPDNPVVTIEDDAPVGDYGPFTGSIPYPESTFAASTTRAGAEASGDSASYRDRAVPSAPSPTPPTPDSVPGPIDARTFLGIDMESVVDAGRATGLKVTWVQPLGVAEKAGLRVGDVIRSANGYLTEEPGNLTWVIRDAAPDGVLKLNVLAAKDGQVTTITARRP